MLATLPPLPAHMRALSDSQAQRLLQMHAPVQNGLGDCRTCKGTLRFRWYADPWLQTPDTVVEYECHCRNQYRLSRNLFAAGLGTEQARMCWGDTVHADERDALPVTAYVGELPKILDQGIGLFLCGPDGETRHGNGKSMFAALIAKKAIQLGQRSWFTTFQQMLDSYTSAWGSGREAKAARAAFDETVRTADVLVIDDVGQESAAYGPARPALDSVFRTRDQAGLVTILTTNLSEEQFLARYDTALASLVSACEKVVFRGESFRKDGVRARARRERELGLSRPWTLV